jgi:SAM-dependent methyltransferase
MSALHKWKSQVQAHHAQSDQIRSQVGATWQDFWQGFSPFFKANPHREGDPEVERLTREVNETLTVLDVGGGAGRFALPLALRCQQVTVVEPSQSMVDGLRELASAAKIENVVVIQQRWEDAVASPANIVLCAHALYSIAELEPFLRKLISHAHHKVLLPTFIAPPASRYAPFWRWVYGQDRKSLPGAVELVNVLWELGVFPDVEMFVPESLRPIKDWNQALLTLRQRLFIKPDSEQDERLQEGMRELLIETDRGLIIKGSEPSRLALIHWQTNY